MSLDVKIIDAIISMVAYT